MIPLKIAMHPSVVGLSEGARELYCELWERTEPTGLYGDVVRGGGQIVLDSSDPRVAEMIAAGLLKRAGGYRDAVFPDRSTENFYWVPDPNCEYDG